MTLPTPTDLTTMNYVYQAQPFIDIPAKSTVDLKTMDYVYQAQPFVRNYISGWTHIYMGVPNASISKIDQVAKTNIATVCGV